MVSDREELTIVQFIRLLFSTVEFRMKLSFMKTPDRWDDSTTECIIRPSLTVLFSITELLAEQ